jgi:hypothetical protein
MADDPIFIVGNGASPASPSNALVINKAGQIGINLGTSLPQAMLHIKAITNDSDMHLRLEHNNNGKYGSVYFDNHFNFQTNNPVGEYRWKDSLGDVILKLDSDGNVTTNGFAEFSGIAISDFPPLNLVQDNQLITVVNKSYLRLLSDTTTETNRTIQLSNGAIIGQFLIIECAEATSSSDGFEIKDNGTTHNTNTGANIIMNTGDVAQFIWNGLDWILIAHSDN